jgi:hypothetical protein
MLLNLALAALFGVIDPILGVEIVLIFRHLIASARPC